MGRYRIKVIKEYSFDLDGENTEDINNKVDTIMNESNILDLPYINKNIKIKIKKIGKRNRNEENS